VGEEDLLVVPIERKRVKKEKKEVGKKREGSSIHMGKNGERQLIVFGSVSPPAKL